MLVLVLVFLMGDGLNNWVGDTSGWVVRLDGWCGLMGGADTTCIVFISHTLLHTSF